MQITLSFEAHELPALLAQLIKLSAGDMSGLASAVMRQAEPDESHASPAEAGTPNPPAQTAEVGDAASMFATPTADVPKTRRTRGPNKPKVQPHTEAVDSADLAPSLPLAVSPVSVPAASPAAQLPAATASPAVPLQPVTVSAPLPQVAAGSVPTIDQLRDAYMAAEMRGASGEQILAIIAAAGVAKVRDIPDDKKQAALDAFNRINAAA